MKPYNKEGHSKGEEVREMFDTIAPTYDRLNHILSLQIDKIWRRRVVDIAKRVSPAKILDLATGTADLAIALAQKLPTSEVTGADPSQGMLAVAKEKIEQRGLSQRISLCVEHAENLSFDSESFDLVTAAFGVRNFSDLEGGIKEMARVTRHGGWVVVLEFSTPQNPLFRAIYNLYSREILPRVGAILSKDRKAYEYLPASVEEFASRDKFLKIMQHAGLERCAAKSQSFGIAQIYVGQKK